MEEQIETVLASIGDLSSFEVRVIQTAALVALLILVRSLLMVIVRRRRSEA